MSWKSPIFSPIQVLELICALQTSIGVSLSHQERSLTAAFPSAPRLRGLRTILGLHAFSLKMWYAAESTSLPQPFVATHASTELPSPTPFRPIAPAPPSGLPGSQIAQTSSPFPCVLGLEGQRGILPCSPDNTAAPAAGTKNPIAQKDADGKFPCPHCTKTYVHAKHLKRHLLIRKCPFPSSATVLGAWLNNILADTGERLYMCVLCNDTFARVDVLKRHFTGCSTRRGNPDGFTHLSQPEARVKSDVGDVEGQQVANYTTPQNWNGMSCGWPGY